MYYLMNKNLIVAEFDIQDGMFGKVYPFTPVNKSFLPYGFTSVDRWLENRKAMKHNQHLRELMTKCGCDKDEGFIQLTHAASIIDTFWVKSQFESVSWNDVSFFQNEFDQTISKLAFEGIGLYGEHFSGTSPELSTDGSFPKCWNRENENIYLYKRGSTGARNAGLEPYCEVLGSELARILCPQSVQYELKQIHGECASRCHIFTSEKLGYAPYTAINPGKYLADDMFHYYKSIGSEEQFRRMIVIDSLTFNVDRHTGNHGILFQTDTMKPLQMAPIFDMNLSLLPYVEKDEFEHIGDKLLQYAPKIGDDFTRTGQMFVDSSIRSDLINLKGFEFSFRGDDKFPEWRVKQLEQMIDKQIHALLNRDKLYTKDIFVPSVQIKNELQELDNTKEDITLALTDMDVRAEIEGNEVSGISLIQHTALARLHMQIARIADMREWEMGEREKREEERVR